MGSIETLAKLVANGGDVSIGFAESTKIVYVASAKIGRCACPVHPGQPGLRGWVRGFSKRLAAPNTLGV